jgi:integrase
MNKIQDVTKDDWDEVNPNNKSMVEEFIRESMQLSPYTLEQYSSALKIFFNWIRNNAANKHFADIKSRDYLLFQNEMIRRGLSSSAIKFKRAAISSFNGYIETYLLEDYPTFRNYINKKVAAPPHAFVNKKEPLTIDEYRSLCDGLEKRGMWQQLAYLKFSFSSGCRRNEACQLLKEVVQYEPRKVSVQGGSVNTYMTHDIRCKGRGVVGKIRKLQFDEDAMNAIKVWLIARGDDGCPHVFVSKQKGGVLQVAAATFNTWTNQFGKMVGRRVHPHLLRETRATTMVVEQGKDIKAAQKLLGHESSSTTEIYVIRKDDDTSDDAFV